MEKYVNDETIIKDDKFEVFKEYIVCPICACLMIEPVMCFSCQNNYCKKCIEKWKERGGECPNKCSNPIFKDVIGRNRLISKFKFKCINGCGAEILFDDIKKHYDSDCPKKEVKPKKRPASQYKPKIKNKNKEFINKNYYPIEDILQNQNKNDFDPLERNIIRNNYNMNKPKILMDIYPVEKVERKKVIKDYNMNNAKNIMKRPKSHRPKKVKAEYNYKKTKEKNIEKNYINKNDYNLPRNIYYNNNNNNINLNRKYIPILVEKNTDDYYNNINDNNFNINRKPIKKNKIINDDYNNVFFGGYNVKNEYNKNVQENYNINYKDNYYKNNNYYNENKNVKNNEYINNYKNNYNDEDYFDYNGNMK